MNEAELKKTLGELSDEMEHFYTLATDQRQDLLDRITALRENEEVRSLLDSIEDA